MPEAVEARWHGRLVLGLLLAPALLWLGALIVLLILDRRRVVRALAVMFFRLKHPRRLLRKA